MFIFAGFTHMYRLQSRDVWKCIQTITRRRPPHNVSNVSLVGLQQFFLRLRPKTMIVQTTNLE